VCILNCPKLMEVRQPLQRGFEWKDDGTWFLV
jgi:hypothetical protein